jgi:hypothetical protein
VHPDVEPIAFLLGTWRGHGRGEYPTIPAFRYGEEVRFWHVGKPFLAYTQRTWSLDDDRPLHAEAGYWRPKPGGRLEVVLAHPTGITEIQEGAWADGRIELAATSLGRTATAKEVTGLTRRFVLDGPDLLRYTVEMAAVGQPLQFHLAAELTRVEPVPAEGG